MHLVSGPFGAEEIALTSTSRGVLAIVAYNEAGRIARCLESVKNSPPPPGLTWREWFILDGGSSDKTIDVAREWHMKSSSAIPFTIRTVTERRGLSADLSEFRAQLIAEERQNEIVVIVEADSTLLANSISNLLRPFLELPDLVETFGICRVDDYSRGRWASGFQLDVSEELARLTDPTKPRAMGRLFAYRVGGLGDFAIIPNAGGFDDQLSAFMNSKHLEARIVPDAVVVITSPTGYRDFYLQTSRVQAGSTATRDVYGAERDNRPTRRLKLRAFINQALKHPLRAVAYLVARLVTLVWLYKKPLKFKDTWTPSLSTKEKSDN